MAVDACRPAAQATAPPLEGRRILHWRLATVVVATAVIAAGCGGGADNAGGSPTATPATEAIASTTTAAAPTTDATSDPAGAETSSTLPEPAPGSTATPAPTQRDGTEAHPSDAYFALERVLDISIEIAGEDWDTLRHQTRTFEDVIAEIEEYGLSRPFADIYTWFPATVTVDGETHADVGVRKKGFLGSQSDTKPALKLRFDKYVDGQSPRRGHGADDPEQQHPGPLHGQHLPVVPGIRRRRQSRAALQLRHRVGEREGTWGCTSTSRK